jgi:iron complex outermembrane receptor protein
MPGASHSCSRSASRPGALRTRAIVCLLLCSPAAAQVAEDTLKGLSLEQLGQIEVTTVSKQPVQVNRTPAAIYVITQDDIRRSGAASLPEALRLAPGVDVARIDSVKWSIGIRGFGTRLSRAVLVLIDGRTVYSPLFHGVYWEVQDTLMEDIERIEVIRGPGGTIWGANAVNGVINIITRTAANTRGALVSAGGGSTNQGALDVRYGDGAGPNWNYRVYGKASARGPEFHFDGHDFDDWRRTQGGFRIDGALDSRDTLTLQGDIYLSRMGEAVRITDIPLRSASTVEKNAELSGGNLLARWERTLDSNSGFYVQAYYDRVNRLQANQAEYRDTFDFDFVHRLGFAGGNKFTWGAGARISLGRVPEVTSTFVFMPDRRTDQLYSMFVQDEIPLGEGVSLTLGTKLLHAAFTGFDAEPSARLLWAPSPAQTFWAAVTRAVRTPSDNEDDLQSTTLRTRNPLAFNVVKGDGAFTSESLLGIEAGYRRLVTRTVSLDVAAFRNHYYDLLSLEPADPFTETAPPPQRTIYPFINRNGVKGSTTGFEIVPNWKPTAWWRVQTSYAFLHMNLSTKPGSSDVVTVASLQGSSPQHQVTVQSYLDLPGRVSFSQIYRHVSELPAQGVESYHAADARVAWKLAPRVEFSVTGQNLLQPRHREFGGDPGPLVGIRRNIFGAVTWRQ